uniref:Copper metabolism (Murr1) domain containing 1 n=1 Tax=Oreochromis niloticus TaxID=8128 RepID=A0A669BZD3_ORENI
SAAVGILDATKSLSGLLNGIAQKVYYNNSEITEELLRSELYPEMSPDEFTALHDKMKGLLKVIPHDTLTWFCLVLGLVELGFSPCVLIQP